MSELLEKTKSLIRSMDESRPVAAERWGVSKRWIEAVLSGEIPNPGVVTVQKIHDDLIERRRQLESAAPGIKLKMFARDVRRAWVGRE